MFTFPVVTSASELCFRLLACWLLFAEFIAPCWSLTSASGWNSRTGGYFTLAWPLTVAVDKVRKCHKGANVMGVENSFSASLAQRLPGQLGHVWLPRGARRDDGARGPLWSLSDCEPPSHMGSIQIHTGCSSLCAGCPLHRLLHDGGQPQPHARGHGAARLNRSHFAAVPSRHWQKCTPGGPPPRPRCGGAVRGADTGGPALSLSGAAPFRRRPSRGRASCRRVAVAVTLSTEHKAWHAGWRT